MIRNGKFVPSKKSLEHILNIFKESRDKYYDSALYTNIMGKETKR